MILFTIRCFYLPTLMTTTEGFEFVVNFFGTFLETFMHYHTPISQNFRLTRVFCCTSELLMPGQMRGKEKNRGIEERGEREMWRDGGRDEEGRKKLGSHLLERRPPTLLAALPPLSSPFFPLPPPCLTCASFSFSSLRVRAPPGSSVTFRITTLFFSQPMNEPSVRPSTTDRKSW